MRSRCPTAPPAGPGRRAYGIAALALTTAANANAGAAQRRAAFAAPGQRADSRPASSRRPHSTTTTDVATTAARTTQGQNTDTRVTTPLRRRRFPRARRRLDSPFPWSSASPGRGGRSPSPPGRSCAGRASAPATRLLSVADPATYRPAPGSIPESPGVYRFCDEHGRVIYVGKAKNLRQRLNSYFADFSALHPRTQTMVRTAARVDWTVVATEVEALQLEYSWIKEFDPRFNVRYRDDKSYPYLAVTLNEEYPRVMVMRGA